MLLRAAGLVAVVRLALWFLPFSLVRRMAGAERTKLQCLALISPRRLSWAIQASARRIPKASCLTQALALQILLTQTGKSGRVHIGVAKDTTRGFEAHAWLEHQGEILVGNNGELGRYAQILALSNALNIRTTGTDSLT